MRKEQAFQNHLLSLLKAADKNPHLKKKKSPDENQIFVKQSERNLLQFRKRHTWHRIRINEEKTHGVNEIKI